MPGPLAARIGAVPHVRDALQIVDEVLVRRVGEAGVLVLLVARIEADGEALRHELEAGKDGHAVDDPAERLARRQREEVARRSCRLARRPFVGGRLEVGDELGRDQVEIGAAAVVVAFAGDVVGDRPVARDRRR